MPEIAQFTAFNLLKQRELQLPLIDRTFLDSFIWAEVNRALYLLYQRRARRTILVEESDAVNDSDPEICNWIGLYESESSETNDP